MIDSREANLALREEVQKVVAAFVKDARALMKKTDDFEGYHRPSLQAMRDAVLSQHELLLMSIEAAECTLRLESKAAERIATLESLVN